MHSQRLARGCCPPQQHGTQDPFSGGQTEALKRRGQSENTQKRSLSPAHHTTAPIRHVSTSSPPHKLQGLHTHRGQSEGQETTTFLAVSIFFRPANSPHSMEAERNTTGAVKAVLQRGRFLCLWQLGALAGDGGVYVQSPHFTDGVGGSPGPAHLTELGTVLGRGDEGGT